MFFASDTRRCQSSSNELDEAKQLAPTTDSMELDTCLLAENSKTPSLTQTVLKFYNQKY